MREIKFRYVFKRPNGHIIKYFTDIQHLERGDMNTFLDANFVAIERDLIARNEYAGLKDKNGKEIYEGDIILTPLGDKAKVIWDDMGAYFCPGFFPEFSGGKRCAGFRSYSAEFCEAVGNIYENPELLYAGE